MRFQSSSSDSFLTIAVIVIALLLLFLYFKSSGRSSLFENIKPENLLR